MQKKVFQLLVDNTSGVLSRIAGLFSRRGYNIESITAGVTADERYTRITIVSSGDDEILDQIEKQVAKLVMLDHLEHCVVENIQDGDIDLDRALKDISEVVDQFSKMK